MAREQGFENAGEMLDAIRVGRLEMPILRHNANVPGETAALARLFWFSGPELAKRMGEKIESDEGHPPQVVASNQSLMRLVASDMEIARPMASWLQCHISPRTGSMFAKGAENAFDGLLEQFAQRHGLKRDDVLAKEAGRAVPRGRGAAQAAMSAGAEL